MPQALIRVDQTGKPPGVAGRAREDLDLAVDVALTAEGGPFAQHRWSLISKPVSFRPTETISNAGLTSPSLPVTLLSPVDKRGTYLVELIVDSGRGLGATELDVARITFYAGRPLAADARRHPRRRPAFGERREHNAPDGIDPAGNREGWAREMARIDAALEDQSFTTGWAAGVTFTVAATANIVRGYNLFEVVWNVVDGWYDVTFLEEMPDAEYAVFVTSEGNPGGSNTRWLIPMVRYKATTGFGVAFSDPLNPGVPDTSDFSFRVELGADPYE